MMKYICKTTMFALSFSRLEKKNMGFTAFLGCFIVTFFLCAVLKPYLGPLPILSLEQSIASGLKMLMSTKEVNEPQQSWSIKPITVGNFTNSRSQVYEMEGEIKIHGNSSTIFIPPLIQQHITNSNWTIAPYARLTDNMAMRKVRRFTIVHRTPQTLPHCTRNFTSPAIIFSTGGYAGNNYHDFSDVLIPLYLTSQHLNKNVIFLVSDMHSWWTYKYKLILENLSQHELIDIDNEKEILCFPRIIVGLKANKELNIDPSSSPHISTVDFTKFLRSTYSSDREFANNDCRKTHRPRLLIISRKKTRHLTNEDKVANMARRLRFEVVVKEMGWELTKVSKFVNSFDVMVAVHGAGITNMVFLPENAVLIQIVPFGLDSVAKFFYEEPTKDMKLRYLEYKVSANESSLFGRYPLDSEIYRNPDAAHNKGWLTFRSVYLDNQDVNVDLGRFRKTLLKALELVCS